MHIAPYPIIFLRELTDLKKTKPFASSCWCLEFVVYNLESSKSLDLFSITQLGEGDASLVIQSGDKAGKNKRN